MNHFIVDGKYRDILHYYGIDTGEVLRKARLPGDILSRKTITMKEDQYYRFLDAVDSVGNTPGLAVKLSSSKHIEHFSAPIFAAYCSKNGLYCLRRLSRYKKLIGPMRMDVSETRDTVTVSYFAGSEEINLPRFVVESEISFIVNIIRRATKDHIVPIKVTTLEEPEGTFLEDFTGTVLSAGSENSVTFSMPDMRKPFISYDEGLWDYFEPELNRRLCDLEVDDSVSARVRSSITGLLPTGECGIDEVASDLGMSRRTLQRKLSEENTTFQKQLNSTREVLAKHYIRNSDMTSNDIAFLLGYAEINSFLRAFMLWTGKSISEYKKVNTADKPQS